MALARKNGSIQIHRELTAVDEIFCHVPYKFTTFNQDGTYLCCLCRNTELFYVDMTKMKRGYVDVNSGKLTSLRLKDCTVFIVTYGEKYRVEQIDLKTEEKKTKEFEEDAANNLTLLQSCLSILISTPLVSKMENLRLLNT